MTHERQTRQGIDAVPLHGAVLCIDCECVTRGLSDECAVCGSHSLLSLERLLGGSQVARAHEIVSIARLDVGIEINLQQVEPRVLSSTVEAITNVLISALVEGRARFHLNVEPSKEPRKLEIVKAA